MPPAASSDSACPLLLQTRACLPPADGTWSLTSRLCRRSSPCRWAQHCSWCRAKAWQTSECKHLLHHTMQPARHSQPAALLPPQHLGSSLHCQHPAVVLHQVSPRPGAVGIVASASLLDGQAAATVHCCSYGGAVSAILHEQQCPLRCAACRWLAARKSSTLAQTRPSTSSMSSSWPRQVLLYSCWASSPSTGQPCCC